MNGSTQAIYSRVFQSICSDIVIGRYKPGDKLPSILVLANALQVEPDTVKRVFMDLEELSVLKGKSGHETFVTEDEIRIAEFRRSFFRQRLSTFIQEVKDMHIGKNELEGAFREAVSEMFDSIIPSTRYSDRSEYPKFMINNKQDARDFAKNFEDYAELDDNGHLAFRFINRNVGSDEIVWNTIKNIGGKWYSHLHGKSWMQLTAKEISNIVTFVLIHREEISFAVNQRARRCS